MCQKLLGYETKILSNGIISAHINLLDDCPSKCVACKKYLIKEKYNIEYNLLVDIIEGLIKRGCKNIMFSGGEPLMYRHLLPILKYCVKNNVNYSMITTLITDDEELLEYIARTAYRIIPSIDSVDRDQYKKIRGVDKWNLVAANFKFICEHSGLNTQIRTSTIVSKLNYDSLYDIAYHVSCVHGKLTYFYPVHTFSELAVDDVQKSKTRHQIDKIMDSKFAHLTNADSWDIREVRCIPSRKCYMGIHNIMVDSDGALYPCCLQVDENNFDYKRKGEPYSNINLVGVEQALDDRLEFGIYDTFKMEMCQHCSDRDGIIERMYELHTMSEVKPLFLSGWRVE